MNSIIFMVVKATYNHYQGHQKKKKSEQKLRRRYMRKMEETGCEVICDAPTTLTVNG